jgi:glyceraldehyde-3-phosphate dehydrogenase (NAD(P))
MQSVRVAVNGYGVIGKRVADAVRRQDDMVLTGVADLAADYRLLAAVELGIPIFSATTEAAAPMRAAGIPLAGSLDELLAASDLVVDATPKRVATRNRERYAAAGRKAIFQGGEEHELTGFSFVATLNYADALGRDLLRVVSCNTTALGRVVGSLHRAGLVKTARAVLFRRGTDAWESHLNAPLNTVVPEMGTPSHQGPDLQTILPELDIVTMAAKGPFDLGHLHFTMVETSRPTTVDEVRDVLSQAPRVALIRAADGLVAQNSIVELMRDLGRPRADLWEVAVWEDALAVRPDGGEIYVVYHVPNEAIVIPETIDAIRAMTELEVDAERSMRKTDASLGLRNRFLPANQGATAPLAEVGSR